MNALAPERLNEVLRYDPESGKLFWRDRGREFFETQRAFSTWNARYAGLEAFTSVKEGYRIGTVFGVKMRAHRVIWALVYGCWPTAFIDHINGQRDDNRLSNLRQATRSENAMNRRLQVHSTSGFKGVCFDKSAGKWVAHIKRDGVRRTLGRFSSADEAAAAYNSAAINAFGEFALLNELPAR